MNFFWHLTRSLPGCEYTVLWKHYFCATLYLHSLLVDCARKLFKPLRFHKPSSL